MLNPDQQQQVDDFRNNGFSFAGQEIKPLDPVSPDAVAPETLEGAQVTELEGANIANMVSQSLQQTASMAPDIVVNQAPAVTSDGIGGIIDGFSNNMEELGNRFAVSDPAPQVQQQQQAFQL
ncbi:MAG: hypothetical protein AAF569_07845 [Pseudomonadota bacterium]